MDELQHHGIVGQKWGERRWQNEDGSWTPAGRLKYGKGDDISKNLKKAAESGMSKRQIVRQLSKNRDYIKQEAKTVRRKKAIVGYATKDHHSVATFGTRRLAAKHSAQRLLGKHANDVIEIGKHSYRAEEVVARAIRRKSHFTTIF